MIQDARAPRKASQHCSESEGLALPRRLPHWTVGASDGDSFAVGQTVGPSKHLCGMAKCIFVCNFNPV